MFTVESQKSHLYNRVNKTDAKNNKIQMILGMFSFFFWDELLKDNIASLFFFLKCQAHTVSVVTRAHNEGGASVITVLLKSLKCERCAV